MNKLAKCALHLTLLIAVIFISSHSRLLAQGGDDGCTHKVKEIIVSSSDNGYSVWFHFEEGGSLRIIGQGDGTYDYVYSAVNMGINILEDWDYGDPLPCPGDAPYYVPPDGPDSQPDATPESPDSVPPVDSSLPGLNLPGSSPDDTADAIAESQALQDFWQEINLHGYKVRGDGDNEGRRQKGRFRDR